MGLVKIDIIVVPEGIPLESLLRVQNVRWVSIAEALRYDPLGYFEECYVPKRWEKGVKALFVDTSQPVSFFGYDVSHELDSVQLYYTVPNIGVHLAEGGTVSGERRDEILEFRRDSPAIFVPFETAVVEFGGIVDKRRKSSVNIPYRQQFQISI